MIKTGKSYVYGTAAEQIEYDVYQENKVLKQKKLQRSYAKEKAKITAYMLIIFTVLFILIYRFAIITEMNYEMKKLTKEYNAIVNDNQSLRVEIEKDTDLFKIQEIAENKLGMQKPDKFQMIYIKVPKGNFSRVTKESDTTETNNVINVILDKINQWASLLY